MLCVFPQELKAPSTPTFSLIHTHTHNQAPPGIPAFLQLPDTNTSFSLSVLCGLDPLCSLGTDRPPFSQLGLQRAPAGCPGPWHTTLLVRGLKLEAHRANSTCLQFFLAGSVLRCEYGSCTHTPGCRLHSSPLPNSSSPQFPHFL